MAGIIGISAYQQIGNTNYQGLPGKINNHKNTTAAAQNGIFSAAVFNPLDKKKNEKTEQSQQMRKMIRGLKQAKDETLNPLVASSKDKVEGFLELSGSPEQEEEEELKKPVVYSYKDVASRIQKAKTSLSAEQAVLSAKRKVMEIKRKISTGDGDAEELQFALTHAKRMEMVARKKKHHLELEEMVAVTQKKDEREDKLEETSSDIRDAIINAEEEKITEREDEIFEERSEMITEAAEELDESSASSDDMLTELNKLVSEFGEEELKQLEESMEMLEEMEVVDPHMSKEDFEDLKRKHRTQEEKEIVKANMDYLKDMIKHQIQRGTSSINTGSSINSGFFFKADESSIPGETSVESYTLDIQI
ncbi:MAG: hypothetical protein E7302_11555 [Butyrivibrio sp.]|nr:hypothetical protein [Butyrivibrio sp.]